MYGVINTINAFLPLLKKGTGKQIFVTSSTLGSIGGPYGQAPVASACQFLSFLAVSLYLLRESKETDRVPRVFRILDSISKTAVNMYTVKLARELAEEGFTVVRKCLLLLRFITPFSFLKLTKHRSLRLFF